MNDLSTMRAVTRRRSPRSLCRSLRRDFRYRAVVLQKEAAKTKGGYITEWKLVYYVLPAKFTTRSVRVCYGTHELCESYGLKDGQRWGWNRSGLLFVIAGAAIVPVSLAARQGDVPVGGVVLFDHEETSPEIKAAHLLRHGIIEAVAS